MTVKGHDLRDNRTLIVEFAGLPGSGKSTVMAAVEAANSAVKITSHYSSGTDGNNAIGRIWSRISSPTRLLFSRPSIAMRTATYWWHATNRSVGSFKHVLRCWSLLSRTYFTPSWPGSVLLLDQGLIQAIGSISVPGKNRPLPSPYLEGAPNFKLDGVIWLECSQDVARNRRSNRSNGESRFETSKTDEVDTEAARFEQAIRSEFAAAQNAGVPFLIVNSSLSPSENAEQIITWIGSLT